MQGYRKRMMVLMFLVLLAMLCAAGCGDEEDGVTLEQLREQPEEQKADQEEAGEESGSEAVSEDAESEEMICVYVCGQVAEPGVYELPPESRVYQAVEAAGGMLETAEDTFVNQAERMTDGQRIYIPSEEEVRSGEWAAGGGNLPTGGTPSDGRVNINTASKEELMTLTGIGEKRAEAIIQYRDTNGGFQNTEQLMEVEGIKEGTFEKIKEDIII